MLIVKILRCVMALGFALSSLSLDTRLLRWVSMWRLVNYCFSGPFGHYLTSMNLFEILIAIYNWYINLLWDGADAIQCTLWRYAPEWFLSHWAVESMMNFASTYAAVFAVLFTAMNLFLIGDAIISSRPYKAGLAYVRSWQLSSPTQKTGTLRNLLRRAPFVGRFFK